MAIARPIPLELPVTDGTLESNYKCSCSHTDEKTLLTEPGRVGRKLVGLCVDGVHLLHQIRRYRFELAMLMNLNLKGCNHNREFRIAADAGRFVFPGE